MENTEKIVQDYVDYVQKTIAEFSDIGNLIDDSEDGEITPHRVNLAMSKFYNISLALTSEYQRQKINYTSIEIDYQTWYDEKFQEAKRKVISEYSEGTRSIKPSVKEFETTLRTDNKEEWKSWTLRLREQDSKVQFLRRLMDTLNKYDNILTTLSFNMRAEMKALQVDARSNKDPNQARSNKVRRKFPVAE